MYEYLFIRASIAPMSRAALEKSVFRVEELDCATEENELRAALGGLPQVSGLDFDLVARRVTVTHQFGSPSPIESAIRDAGMRPRLIIPVVGENVASKKATSMASFLCMIRRVRRMK